ncbi:MAG TPA: Cof-type HAD-IIB family hydrolase [Steroidobacteraceae bacterium]
MIGLVGIDVDGTLVGRSGEVAPRVWETVELARSKGIRLVLCSGRPAFGRAVEYARRLDDQGWHAFQNGASIVNLPTRQSRSVPLPAEAVATFIAKARANGSVLELYSDQDWVEESSAPWAVQHADLLGVKFEPRTFESLDGPVVRAQWLLTLEQASHFMSRPHPGLEVSQSTSPLMPGTQFVGFTREGVSKASAMRTIAQEYGISMEDVMYIGDSGNDIPALRAVGHPVAMANSDPGVIDVAERVVAHVDEGGVADALRLAISSA